MDKAVARIALLVMTLAGVIGRKAGSVTGFAYSPGMRAAGWSWSSGLLDSCLAAPRKTVRGTSMLFTGVRVAADRAAVICYMAGASAPARR